MSYTAPAYFLMIAVLSVFYYLVPKQHRYLVLLAGSMLFYYLVSSSIVLVLFFLLTTAFTFGMGILLQCASGQKRNVLLSIGWIILLCPLMANRARDFLLHGQWNSWVLPVGISFYTMQLCAYLSDIARGKITPQKHFAKFVLFASFFPQIIQGPIPRYGLLSSQLEEGHDFDEQQVTKGIYLVIGGLFLKYMIADHAAPVVSAVFENYASFSGRYIWLAGILYSIQLYADFLSCTTMSQGVSLIFGIRLADNFDHPYFSVSIRDFWRRWHISLSSWLRDYVYIPLGGSRRGTLRKYINLCVTFLVSGLWHGGAVQYLVWGMYHAGLQIAESLLPQNYERLPKAVRILITDLLVMIGWIFFRAQGLRAAAVMILGLFRNSGTAGWSELAIDGYDMAVLALSCLILLWASITQRRSSLSDELLKRPLPVRWTVLICLIFSILIFGAYGSGFDAQDFIYGGF
ncbi:MAG: MBOAT family protein [Solobacterium sp.]|nr:MBOAT family protein [Solobacterium sp.]